MPAAKSAAPTAGPTSWFIVIPAVISRALPMPRSRLSTTIGSRVLAGRVDEDLGGAQQEQRSEDDGDVDPAGDQRRREDDEHARPQQVDRDHEAAGGRSGRPGRRRRARTAATAGAAAARPSRRGADRRSARRRAADRRPARSRRRDCPPTTSRPASGTASPCEPGERPRPRLPRPRTLCGPRRWPTTFRRVAARAPLNPLFVTGNRTDAPRIVVPRVEEEIHDPVAGVAWPPSRSRRSRNRRAG